MAECNCEECRDIRERAEFSRTAPLYIEQLRSCIGDLVAAGKARRGFQTLWKLRLETAKDLLARPGSSDSASGNQDKT